MVFHNPQPWFNTLCNLVADLFIVGGQTKTAENWTSSLHRRDIPILVGQKVLPGYAWMH